MSLIYYSSSTIWFIIPWILQAVAYYFLLRKMQLKKWTAIIPFLADRQFTSVLFRRMRTFYRPFVVSGILVLAACYLDPAVEMGRAFMLIAALIYGIFQLRLYWRMAKAMGKGKGFAVLLILFPIVFLLILGLGKSQYQPLELKPLKEYSKTSRAVHRTALAVVSTVEIVAIVAAVGFLTIQDTPPEFLVNSILNDVYKNTKDVSGTGEVITREAALGKAAGSIKEMKPVRAHYYQDNANAKNVVVMAYIVGSNLEENVGYASVNIRQMVDATKQGDGVTFVMEAGGADRWFTKGIEDASCGRYTISGGKVEKVKELPSDTCMAEPETLADFISWTKENYPADRYMLVLWDHGGGVPYGYGSDDLNPRYAEDGTPQTMMVSEIASALKKADVKFDVLGFDACLMQDIEIASALEPYADYYLASEETEGGYGWFYTGGFGKLAQDPGMKSVDFGREMVACYDPFNDALRSDDSSKNLTATLSFVDLTLAAPAYEKLTGLLNQARDAIRDDPGCFADVAGAASNAYAFYGDLQIDLVGFLKILDKMDYAEEICSHKEKLDLIRSIQGSILYQNGATAKGVYGMSFAFPYKSIIDYNDTSKELKRLALTDEKKTFDEIFSIMAAQQKKDKAKKKKALKDDPSLHALMEVMMYADYTNQSWYIKGFEDYDQSKAFVDIPLKETGDGYSIELPDKAWKIISDCQTMVYQKTEGEASGAVMRYLGTDHIGSDDADGHPLIAMDENWVHIDGNLVCYEATPVLETDEGDVFTGTVNARLNNKKDIVLKIEWDPVAEGQEGPVAGHVTGYINASLSNDLSEIRDIRELKAGDTIQFLFDYYDAEGELIETRPEGDKIRVTKQDRLTVSDAPLGACDILFSGVLTDIYQRVLTTEQIELHLDGTE